jgi:hypothetical protein
MGTTYSEVLGKTVSDEEYDRLFGDTGIYDDEFGVDPEEGPFSFPLPGEDETLDPEGTSISYAMDTIGPGRSTTPGEAADAEREALAYGFPQEDIDRFLAENPGDYERMLIALRSGGDRSIPGTYDTLEDDPGYDPEPEDTPPPPPPPPTVADPTPTPPGPGPGPRTTPPRPPFQPDPTTFGSDPDSNVPDTPIDINALMELLRNINVEPGRDVNLPSAEELPVIDVPGVNLSSDIDNTILSILRGEDASTAQTDASIQQILDEISGTGRPTRRDFALRESEDFYDQDRLNQRLLNLTEQSQQAQQGLMAQLRSQLAESGTISLPGVPQGAETAGSRRVTERVASSFAQALRDAGIRESELADVRSLEELRNATTRDLEKERLDVQEIGQADERELSALQLATGWSSDKATRVLQGAAAGTDRQRILSGIAIETLDRNIVWNQFLFQAGIQREELAEDIRAGRLDRIGSILTGFGALLQQLRGGYIGED